MARIKLDISSDMLQQTMTVDLFFPNDQGDYNLPEPAAVIYLLHGMHGNSNSWFERTAITRYASDNNIIIICPQAHNSFYADNYFGEKYFTFFTEELPTKLHSMFKMPTGRDKTFVAGLSMGGYGAMLLGLSRPDLYSACATFSGALGYGDNRYLETTDEFVKRYVMPVLGPDCKMKNELTIEKLADKVAKLAKEKQPRVLCTCGLQDYLYDMNNNFKEQMSTLPIDFTYMEWEGEHKWDFWDKSVVYAISFFLNNDYDKTCHDQWMQLPAVEKSGL